MADNLAIEIRGLTKSYGSVQALRGVDLRVREAELFGFLGPNGAGKTTTIRCLLDLIRPQSGILRLLGYDPQQSAVEARRQVGYLPGELSIDPNMSVEGALRYLSGLRGQRAEWAHVRGLTARLDLDVRSAIKNLSRGNKQKVGIVQALMHRPRLLLLDEPTTGLDPLMQQEVYRLLREAQAEGCTVFFSSHIISEVEQLAERVAIIREGIIVEEAQPARLRQMALRRVHVRFTEPVEFASLSTLPGVNVLMCADGTRCTLQVAGEMGTLIQALGHLPVRDLETEHPSLEEIFLAYYERKEPEGGAHGH